MQTYAFTVLTNSNSDPQIVDAVYGACADASAMVENGKLAIAFDRESDSLESAIRGALNALKGLSVDIASVTLDVESLAVLQ